MAAGFATSNVHRLRSLLPRVLEHSAIGVRRNGTITHGALASGHDVTHLLPGVEQVQAGVVDIALLLRCPE